jgi:hypothetical protein
MCCNSYSKLSALRELSGANDGKAAVPDYLEATVYNKAGKDKILDILNNLFC